MADLSDVENVLLATVTPIVYPNGNTQPSIVNAGVRLYRGWPIAAQLDTDLAAGLSHVSIYSMPNMERNITPYPRDDEVVTAPVNTVTAIAAGNAITIGGTISTPQNVIVLAGNRKLYAYAVKSNDTLASIATAVAALIAADFPGTAAVGPVITIAGKPGVVQARVAGAGQVGVEEARQQKWFMITCWCPTPPIRDLLAKSIDLALKQIDFLTMPDGWAARLRYERTQSTDDAEKVQLYRRDLIFMVEYATVALSTVFEIGAIGVTVQGGPQGDGAAPSNTTYY